MFARSFLKIEPTSKARHALGQGRFLNRVDRRLVVDLEHIRHNSASPEHRMHSRVRYGEPNVAPTSSPPFLPFCPIRIFHMRQVVSDAWLGRVDLEPLNNPR